MAGVQKSAYKAPTGRIWAEVEFLAAGLASGESSRGVCPKCLGGSSGEKSFLCSRDTRGIAYFICFRATCGYRGTVDIHLGPGSSKGPALSPEPPRKVYSFRRELRQLTESQVKFWRAKFDINPGNEVYYCPEMERFALRVYGPQGQHRGWELKLIGGTDRQKTISYPEQEFGAFIGWFNPSEVADKDEFSPVIVVEDLISARKVSDAGYRAVALLGTTKFGLEEVYEIRAETDSIVLALDRGTMNLMLRYRQKYGLLFDDIVIWQLDKDLKYVSRQRIREAVEDGKPDFISHPDDGGGKGE